MEDIILIGYGGHAKSVADCIERQKKYRIIGYTEIAEVASKYPYLGDDNVLKEYYKKGVRNVAICQGYLGKGNLRERLYKHVKEIGFKLPVIIDPSSIIANSAIVAKKHISKGEILCEENLTTKRPGSGISPMKWYDVIGTFAVRDFSEDEMIEI